MNSPTFLEAKKTSALFRCLLAALIACHPVNVAAQDAHPQTKEKPKKAPPRTQASGRASAKIVKPMSVRLVDGKIQVTADVRHQISRNKRGDVTVIFE